MFDEINQEGRTMNATQPRKRDGKASFVGVYLDPADKRRLKVLAQLQRTTVTGLVTNLLQDAVKPLAELTNEG